tara:strand:+ start:2816 stop:3463 length:648 start_codon:yes stop_codon:yes gene_type:complete
MSDLLSAQPAAKKVFPPSGNYLANEIAAGETQIIRAAGDHFYFAENTGRLLVGTDLTAESPYSVGEGEEVPEGNEFTTITLKNDSADDITFEVFVGRNRRIDRRLNVVDGRLASVERVMSNSTEILSSATVSIANAGSVVFSGVPTGTQIQRKAIIVTNEDAAGKLEISDGTNVGAMIFKESNFLLEAAGSIEIHNNSGGVITCKIMEIWYVNNP